MRNVYFFCPWYFTHPIHRHCFSCSSIGVTNGALTPAPTGRHHVCKGISHPQIHSLWRWRLQRLSKRWVILTAIRDRPPKADPPHCLLVCSSIPAVASCAYLSIKRNSLRKNSHVAWHADKASCIMKRGAVWIWVGRNGKKKLRACNCRPSNQIFQNSLSGLVGETFWQMNYVCVIICHFIQRWSTDAVDPVANNKLTRIISGKTIVTPVGDAGGTNKFRRRNHPKHSTLTAGSFVEGLLCILLTTDCTAGDWGCILSNVWMIMCNKLEIV